MATPSGSGFSYKPNVNRAVTKKWREASQANYGGDDWGDEDDYDEDEPPAPAPAPAPVSTGNARHPGWGGQHQPLPSNRSVTNPSPSIQGARPSFDQGDERRYFSGGTSGFDSAYPTTQRTPFAEPQHEFDQPAAFRPPPPHIQTPGQGPYPPPFRPGSRGAQYASHPNAPFSAPGGFPHQRSQSGNRSNPGDPYQRRESPVRPDSRASNGFAKHFPPRKSSLSQQQPPPDLPPMVSEPVEPLQSTATPGTEVKALPFIRPSDIYKRMEEEREKERRSQDSARPSLELNTSRTRDSSTSARSTTSEAKDAPAPVVEDSDSTRRLKPTLDTVVERKSEYGFDNMLKDADSAHPSLRNLNAGVDRHPTNASSVYTNRPDPVSATSASPSDIPGRNEEPYSASSYQHNLPSLGKVSSFGSDFSSSMNPTSSDIAQPDHLPPPVPTKDTKSIEHTTPAPGADALTHTPSAGYRSVVEQAFDQNDVHGSLSPSETLPRSNSASTSELSPIIARQHNPPGTQQSIPEEPLSSGSRPLSDSTIKPNDAEQPLAAPPAIQSGYRRDRTPPSRDNSPAKHPLNIHAAQVQRPVQGVLNSTEDIQQQVAEERARGRSGMSPAAPSDPTGLGGLTSPQSNHSTTSDDYNAWQDQRKQFNGRFGLLDSNPTTPDVPSPIFRSESPSKGNVKDFAGRYEDQSGRSTRVSNPTGLQIRGTEVRPPIQTRQESFRPSIPGGWQSSSTVPQVDTPREEVATPVHHAPRSADQPRFDSTDSIPTAKAPQNWRQEDGPSRSAFAAAAAAGTALAGAFSGPALTRSRNDSPTRSEDSWEKSAASSVHAPEQSDTRDFGAGSSTTPGGGPPTQVSLPPTPVPKDSPVPTPQPSKLAASTLRDEATEKEAERGSPTESYFPAPLRTSRSVDANEIMRPPIPKVHHVDDASPAGDNDELQRDIVKSLTPKSSNFEPQDEHTSNMRSALPTEQASAAPIVQNVTQPDAPRRPFLEQRFSWETEQERTPNSRSHSFPSQQEQPTTTPSQVTSPSLQSPDTIRAVERSSSETPTKAAQNLPSPTSATTQRPVSDDIVAPPTILKDTGPPPANPTAITGYPEKMPFRKILAMEHPQQRFKAFSDARDSYAQSDGMLDQWILSMQSPEHADVFQTNGQVRQPASVDPNSPHRPSPNRPLVNMGGSKIMQEDGKRLMAASKRFGGKAGVAAKGLFAKGKDKLRSASAGDKGFLTTRRKSAGPDLVESPEPSASKRDSTLLTVPPQIPAQDLSISPIDSGDWFGSDRGNQHANPVLSKTSTSELDRFSPISRDSQLEPTDSTRDLQSRPRSPPISIPSRGATPAKDDVLQSSAVAEPDQGVRLPAEQATVPVSLSNLQTKEIGPVAVGTIHEPTPISGDSTDRQLPVAEGAPQEDLLNIPEQADLPSSEQSLAIPTQRPHSVISQVSSVSPATSNEGQQLRSVSPAEPRFSQDEVVPPYQAPGASKEEEAMVERRAGEVFDDNEPVPSYHESSATDKAANRLIGPDAQIVPVTDLSGQRRQQEIRTAERPFSFDGTEYLSQAVAANERKESLQSPPSLPLSPVSQTMSKSLSQVSVEEVTEDSEAPKKHARSYSRPFGASADVMREHPALRQPDQAMDRSRMYSSSESPLPSARRPQEDLDRLRQQSPTPAPAGRTDEDRAYKVPGPYFQELRSPRSPRHTFAQNVLPPTQQVQHPSQHQQANGIAQQPFFSPQQQQPQPIQQQHVMSPPPQAESSKKSRFGGLFQTKSKTRVDSEGATEDRQRNKLLRRSSRQDSIASQQSSINEKRDVLGQLPPMDMSKGRMSRDGSRSATPTDQTDRKKKRFSAMGNLFSRNSRSDKTVQPQRASTLPTGTPPPNKEQYPGPSQQYHYGRPGPQNNPSHAQYDQPQFSGSPPPAGGYYGPRHQGPPRNVPPEPQSRRSQYQQIDPRSVDLRIDTSNTIRATPTTMPATAPPQTHASRDISYQSQPYEYQPPSQRVQSPPAKTPTPTTANSTASRNHNPHVVSLHKRSRSPKLGRRSSEDLTHLQPADTAGTGPGTGTPVSGLGMFSNKKVSPLGGIPRPDQDQEAPFRIDIPGEPGEEERRRSMRQKAIEQQGVGLEGRRGSGHGHGKGQGQGQTVAERMTGPQMSVRAMEQAKKTSPTSVSANPSSQMQTQRTAGAGAGAVGAAAAGGVAGATGSATPFVAELPGSKAEGYESDEEIQMSATAYPGNWQDPVFFGDGKWDD